MHQSPLNNIKRSGLGQLPEIKTVIKSVDLELEFEGTRRVIFSRTREKLTIQLYWNKSYYEQFILINILTFQDLLNGEKPVIKAYCIESPVDHNKNTWQLITMQDNGSLGKIFRFGANHPELTGGDRLDIECLHFEQLNKWILANLKEI